MTSWINRIRDIPQRFADWYPDATEAHTRSGGPGNKLDVAVPANVNAEPAPEELPPSQPRGVRYPVEALGERGASAALAIEGMVQSPVGLGAQSVLSTMSLVTSGLGTVSTLLHGHRVPGTLYCMTIAVSGERKSASDSSAIGPLRRLQEDLIADHVQAQATYRTACRAKAKGEPEPAEPQLNAILCDDPTYEGLLKIGSQCAGFLGWFTDEGAMFVGGYAMGKDQRAKTGGGLCRLCWVLPLPANTVVDGKPRRQAYRLNSQLPKQGPELLILLIPRRIRGISRFGVGA